MPRKRQIDPQYPFEDEIARLSIPARYFYILSWCYMDDNNGVLPYEPRSLKLQTFPEDVIEVKDIINELIEQRRLFPFEAKGKQWLWCPAFLNHQTIRHPSAIKCPNPPKELKQSYRSTHVVPRQSRVEESRVEKEQEPSAELNSLIKQVHKKGFKIAVLINRFKKDQKARKALYIVPDEVYIAVCEEVLKADLSGIKSHWAYFMRILQAKSEEYFANKNIKEGNKHKEQKWAVSIKDLIK